jgi:hypothetical protein
MAGEGELSTPIYKNEHSWRGHMLVAEMATPDSLRRVEMTIVGVLVLYLVSIYSMPAALGCGVIWWCVLALVAYGDDKSRRGMLANLMSDPDVDF